MRLPALLLALAVLAAPADATPPRAPRLPSIMLWAWERPEDLRFLAGRPAGVAYLAQTLTLSGDAVEVHSRQQPLRMAPGIPLVPVTRIELARMPPVALSATQRHEIAMRIARLAVGAPAVQVDFDAPVSARAFYRALLADIRRELPAGTALSMTALASWCQGDAWLDDAPVDEVVPMLFRMGPTSTATRARLAQKGGFDCAACGGAIGLAADEAPWTADGTGRVYLWSAAPWTGSAFERALGNMRHATTR